MPTTAAGAAAGAIRPDGDAAGAEGLHDHHHEHVGQGLDRLLQKSVVLNIRDRSYRLQELEKALK
jgi:hypothetical protein